MHLLMSSHLRALPIYINMKEKVHYEENLFCISMRIKQISQQLNLNIAPEYFSEQIAKEILFLHKTLQLIFEDLTKNSFLINRKQYLYSLLKVKGLYNSMLKSYLENSDLIIKSQTIMERIHKILEVSGHDIGDIRSILTDEGGNEVDKDLISTEEMNFLMAPGLIDED